MNAAAAIVGTSTYPDLLQVAQEATTPDQARWVRERVDEWASQLKGVSEATRLHYRQKVQVVYRRLEAKGFEPATRDVTARMVDAIRVDPRRAPTTRNHDMLLWRKFLRWTNAPIAEDPDVWRLPRWVASNRDWATLDEICLLVNTAPTDQERLLVSMMGTCGLRESEAAAMTPAHVKKQAAGGWAFEFRGKFDKPRRVPLSSQAIDALVPVVAVCTPQDLLCGFNRKTVWDVITRLCKAAEIRHLRPHDLRRGFGREFLRANAGNPRALPALQDIYGHEDVGETVYYVGLDREAADEGMSAFSRAIAKKGAGR